MILGCKKCFHHQSLGINIIIIVFSIKSSKIIKNWSTQRLIIFIFIYIITIYIIIIIKMIKIIQEKLVYPTLGKEELNLSIGPMALTVAEVLITISIISIIILTSIIIININNIFCFTITITIIIMLISSVHNHALLKDPQQLTVNRPTTTRCDRMVVLNII